MKGVHAITTSCAETSTAAYIDVCAGGGQPVLAEQALEVRRGL